MEIQGNVLENPLYLKDGGMPSVLTDSRESGFLAINPISYDLGQTT